jgi:ATP-binding cassette subfamily F protein 3
VVEERVAPFTLPSPAAAFGAAADPAGGRAVGYDGTPVLRNLNLRLDVDDRIGLLGVNGAGQIDLRQDDRRRAAAAIRPAR